MTAQTGWSIVIASPRNVPERPRKPVQTPNLVPVIARCRRTCTPPCYAAIRFRSSFLCRTPLCQLCAEVLICAETRVAQKLSIVFRFLCKAGRDPTYTNIRPEWVFYATPATPEYSLARPLHMAPADQRSPTLKTPGGRRPAARSAPSAAGSSPAMTKPSPPSTLSVLMITCKGYRG